MANRKAKKIIGAIILLTLVVGGLYYTGALQALAGLDVLSVSRIWLNQRGVGSAGQELTGGFWRVEATTGSAETQFIDFNDAEVAEKAVQPGDYPSDVQVTGSITVGVFQTQNPYWHLPVVKVEDITVYPTISTMNIGTIGNNFFKVTQMQAQPLVVSLWKVDLANKELVIPFSVGVLKTAGENPTSFTTDYPGAVAVTSDQGTAYDFDVSFRQIASGELSKVVNWYNPNDPTETVKMTLQFTVGGSEYDWNKEFLFVTTKDGGPITNNVFNTYDLANIRTLLNYNLGSDWSFYHYFFGGGNVFKGKGSGYGEATTENIMLSWGGDDTSVKPVINYNPFGIPLYSAICEGYIADTSTLNNVYQYPGWYVPAPGNQEGPSTTVEYWKFRCPLGANVYSDIENRVPKGLSVVNYLATSLQAPTNAAPWKPTTLQRENPNYYGAGYAGDAPNGYEVQIPMAARQWYFTLDVSTEAADTVVVTQSYIDATIQSFSVDRTDVGAGQAAFVNAQIKNNSPFAGTISQGIAIPSGVSTSCAVTGGDGALYFAAGETKTVTLQVKNTGNLVTDTAVAMTYKLQNTEPRVTDQRQFQLKFLSGLGVPDSVLSVYTLDADSRDSIGGVAVKAYYGVSLNQYQSANTLEGLATLNLGQYHGSAKVMVSDPADRYSDQEKTINVAAGANSVTFLMSTGSPPSQNWLLIGAIIAGFIIVAIAVVASRRKTAPKTLPRRRRSRPRRPYYPPPPYYPPY